MKVEQLKELLTQMTKEMLGDTVVLNEDLSNLVDVGKNIENLFTAGKAYENALHTICDKVGKTVTVNRPLERNSLGILKTGTEYGSIIEKIKPELPEFQIDEAWQLQDGSSYDDHIYYQPKASVTFYDNKSAYSIKVSRALKQLQSAFKSPQAMLNFVDGIETFTHNSYTLANEGLELATVRSAIGETIYSAFNGGTISGKTSVKAVNLLYQYNTLFGKTLTATNCIFDPEFQRYAASQILVTMDRLKPMSKVFNIEKQPRHTPRDLLHIILHADFVAYSGVYLQSDTFHNTFTALPYARTVPYWQGDGQDFSFAQTSKIDVKTGGGHDVSATGIIGVMFDHDALGVYNEDMSVETSYTKSARFYTNYYNWESSHFNALDENIVVFYVA